MNNSRKYKALGAVLLAMGVGFLAFGFSGRQPGSFRIGGAVLLFFGIVLFAQARKPG